MATESIRVITENLKEEKALRAIFRDESGRGLVTVQSFLTSSAALGSAEYSLLTHRGRPVALVVNSDAWSPEEIEEERATIHRILYRASPRDWHVSIAQPNVDAWLMSDPSIRAIFDSDEVTRTSVHDRAVRVAEVAASRPIDREAIARAHPDFAALAEFIATHSRAPEAVA